MLIKHLILVITDKMDQILSSENDPWELLDQLGFNCGTTSNSSMAIDNNLEMEELKIPKVADQFIRLLDAIKERYCCLPQPTHQ